MWLRVGNLGVLISEVSLILTVRGTDSDQEHMFTYTIHDYADWLEHSIRLRLAWYANYCLGKEETCLQKKKKQTLARNQDAAGRKKSQSQQTPLWPSSAMKHIQSSPTTATNHYYLG